MKTIVAFANTQVGRLIVGVDDKTHQIVGVENDVLFQLMDGMANVVSDFCVSQSHTIRYTGGTRLGENNVNPKVIQYVMGRWMSSGHPFSADRSEDHSDAQITMNVYNHIAEKSHVENEMSKMNLPETVPAVV